MFVSVRVANTVGESWGLVWNAGELGFEIELRKFGI